MTAFRIKVTYVSPSVEKLRGYTVQEVLSQPVKEIMTPESYHRIMSELPQRINAFRAGDPPAVSQIHEIEQPTKDGSTVWTEVATTLKEDESGGLSVIGVSRDISRRKEAEKELLEKRNLLAAMPLDSKHR